ncbi:MAG: hypothetical protein V4509_00640 [Patescibacteria group bacterium]
MTNYEQYVVLDAKIKELEAQKESLRTVIITDMADQGESKVVTEIGTFTVSKLKKWTYPEAVTSLGEKFKAAKAKAESTGEATYEEQDSLRFTSVKL